MTGGRRITVVFQHPFFHVFFASNIFFFFTFVLKEVYGIRDKKVATLFPFSKKDDLRLLSLWIDERRKGVSFSINHHPITSIIGGVGGICGVQEFRSSGVRISM